MIVVSFSGGRTSAYMASLLLKQHDRKNLMFVFANTGKENPETLDFINECDKRWGLNVVWLEAKVLNYDKSIDNQIVCEYKNGKLTPVKYEDYTILNHIYKTHKFHHSKGFLLLGDGLVRSNRQRLGTTYDIVNYDTASRNGQPFEAVNLKYGIPNKHSPHCTRELKETTIKKYVRDVCGNNYKMAIGIRADERIRINMNRAKKYQWIYPLVYDTPTTKRDVMEFWKKQNFDLQLPDYLGNCDLCWKKSLKKRIQILQEKPQLGDWWENEESKSEYVFDRDNNTIGDIRKMSKEQSKQISLFDNDVSCSCFSNVQFD